ncbi:MAG TPA: hypothetical protein ACQGQW_05045, partial [Xylella fastidiosa subsp. pauca]
MVGGDVPTADTRAAAGGACEPSIKNIALSRGVHVLLLCAGMRLWPGQCCLGQNGPMKGSVVKSSVVLGVVLRCGSQCQQVEAA